jgi:hypothetical protein
LVALAAFDGSVTVDPVSAVAAGVNVACVHSCAGLVDVVVVADCGIKYIGRLLATQIPHSLWAQARTLRVPNAMAKLVDVNIVLGCIMAVLENAELVG